MVAVASAAVGLMSTQELLQLATFGDVMTWAGLAEPAHNAVRASLLTALGATADAMPRSLGLIPEVEFNDCATTITTPGRTADDAPVTPTAFQKGAVALVG